MQTGDVTAREKVFNMRMSLEEWERLEVVAADLGLNAANAIRVLVKRHHDAMPQKPAPKKPKAKR